MRGAALACALAAAACNFDLPPDIDAIPVEIAGLWDGSDPVVLTITDEHATRTVAQGDPLGGLPAVAGDAYTVEVTAPAQHTCAITEGATGTADADARIAIRCVGPGTARVIAPDLVELDTALDRQSVPLSVLAQGVTFELGGALTGVSLDGQPIELDRPATLLVPESARDVEVTLVAGPLSRTFTVQLDHTLPPMPTAEVHGPLLNDQFGAVMATDDHWLVVGSEFHQKVFVFDLETDPMLQAPEILESATASFGHAVAISGDTLVVGCNNAQSTNGVVYAYTYGANGWNTTRKNAVNGMAGEHVGASVAIDGETLVVGAPLTSANNGGHALIATRNPDLSWTVRTPAIRAVAPRQGDEFGASVAVQGRRVLIGAPGDASSLVGRNPVPGTLDSAVPDSGAVYVVDVPTQTPTAYLKPAVQAQGAAFGSRVAFTSAAWVIGAPGEPPGGAVYLYAVPGSSATDLILTPDPAHAGSFGAAIAVGGDVLAVGAPCSDSMPSCERQSVTIFQRIVDMYSPRAVIEAPISGSTDPRFGTSVAFALERLYVGAPLDSGVPLGGGPVPAQNGTVHGYR